MVARYGTRSSTGLERRLHLEPAMQGFMYELAGLSHRYNPFRWRACNRYGFLRPYWHDIEGQQSREWD